MLKIVSIFNTIQGEGRHQGKMVTFVRLFSERCFPGHFGFCNFCDTRNKPYFVPNDMTISEIVNSILEKGCGNRIVITGGEPLAIDIESLMQMVVVLKNEFEVPIDIETNGSFIETIELSELARLVNLIDTITISPKFTVQSYASKFFTIFNRCFRGKVDFKFVVSEQNFGNNINDIQTFLSTIDNVSGDNIYLMPKTPSTSEFMKKVFGFCIDNRYNFSSRLHVMIHGDSQEEI